MRRLRKRAPDPATFRFTRTGDLTFSWSVTYAITGTAANGSDYTGIGTAITFTAGQATVDRTITPIADALVETPETVILTVTDGAQYDLGNAGTETATVTIADAPLVTVAGDGCDCDVESSADTGVFTFTRTGPTTAAVTVSYTVSGTATNGSDYNDAVRLRDDSGGAGVGDADGDGRWPTCQSDDSETVTVTIGARGQSAVCDRQRRVVATVTIADTPAPIVTVAGDGCDGGGRQRRTPGLFTFTRTGPTTEAVTVSYDGEWHGDERSDYSRRSAAP